MTDGAYRYLFDADRQTISDIIKKKREQERGMEGVSVYRTFKIPKKNGGCRVIEAPCFRLKKIQKHLDRFLLRRFHLLENCCGFIKDKSVLDNAKPHLRPDVKKLHILKMDIKDFFPSVKKEDILDLIDTTIDAKNRFKVPSKIGEAIEREPGVLAEILTYKGRLPQGAPTSPTMSNIIATGTDKRIKGLTKRFNEDLKVPVRYTRYADDLTFSGKKEVLIKLISHVKNILKDEGFEVNHRKTSLKGRGARQTVTGVVVNDKPNVPREYRRRIRAILHDCLTNGPEHANRENRYNFKEWLEGHISYIRMINRDLGDKFIEQFERVGWSY